MPFTTADVVTSPQLWCSLLDDDSELEQDLYNCIILVYGEMNYL